MNIMRLTSGAIFITLLSGCANHPFNAVNSTSYSTGEGQTSTVFAWDSQYSAGVGNSNGMCVQGALTAKSSAFSAALTAAVENADVEARGAFSFAQAVMALNASSVQTAYGNAGYFYLCQIALNQSTSGSPLSGPEIMSMWEDVGDTAENIRLSAADLKSLSAPQLDDIRIYMEALGVDDIPEDNTELQEAITEVVDEQTSDTSN